MAEQQKFLGFYKFSIFAWSLLFFQIQPHAFRTNPSGEYHLSAHPWEDNKDILGGLLEFFIKNFVNWAQESSLLSLGILKTVPIQPNHKCDEEMLPYFSFMAKIFDEFYKEEVKLKLSQLNSDKAKRENLETEILSCG